MRSGDHEHVEGHPCTGLRPALSGARMPRYSPGMRYRLVDGPYDGKIVDELPSGYVPQGLGHAVGSYDPNGPLPDQIPETAVYSETGVAGND